MKQKLKKRSKSETFEIMKYSFFERKYFQINNAITILTERGNV